MTVALNLDLREDKYINEFAERVFELQAQGYKIIKEIPLNFTTLKIILKK